MSDRIRELLAEITRLEDEVEAALREQQQRVMFRVEGTRVRFEERIHGAHRKLRVGLLRWLLGSDAGSVLSAPFIYSLIIPFVLLDVWLWMYQSICFPLYGMPKVPRADFIVVDRHHLAYLNSIEKLNCVYCGYANGLIAYAREIASRTEQYWCPIKHARNVRGVHRRYPDFAEFGDGEGYHVHLESYRDALRRPES